MKPVYKFKCYLNVLVCAIFVLFILNVNFNYSLSQRLKWQSIFYVTGNQAKYKNVEDHTVKPVYKFKFYI